MQREYLVNDAGSRLQALGETVLARYLQALGHPAEVPQDGYHGEFLAELGRELAAEHGDALHGAGPRRGRRAAWPGSPWSAS